MADVSGTGRKHEEQGSAGQRAGPASRRTTLFLRMRGGEPHLLGELAEELGELFRRRLRRNSRTRALADNPADEEDVLQQTFLRLWEYRDRFDPERGVIDAWAWVIARNAAVSVLRRRWRTIPATARLDAIQDPRAAQPDAELLAAEGREAFADKLEGVSNPKVRQVLKLRLVAGLPYAAVSEATGVPMGTVANWVHRLRRSLRAA